MNHLIIFSFLFYLISNNHLFAQKEYVFGDTAVGEKGIVSHQLTSGLIWTIGSTNNGTNGSTDIVATCIDTLGNTIRGPFFYGSAALDYPNNMIYHNGKMIVAGETFDSVGLDGCILIIDTLGQLISFQEYGLPNQSEQFFDIKPTTDGGFVVAGFGATQQGVGNDYLIAKFDSNYQEEWRRIHDLGTNDIGVCVVPNPMTGGYLIAGDQVQRAGNYNVMVMAVDSLGDQQWTSLVPNPNNGGCKQMKRVGNQVVIVGEMSTSSSSAFDPYFIRMSLSGNVLHQATIPQSDFGDAMFDIAIQNNNLYHLTGYLYDTTVNNTNLTVLSIDSSGGVVRQQQYGGNSFDMGYDIQLVAGDQLLVTGFSTVLGDNQFFVLKDILSTNTALVNIIPKAVDLQCFPNPATHQVQIKNLNPTVDYKYTIFDEQGKPLVSSTLKKARNIDLSFLTAGLYLIQIKNTTKKLEPYTTLRVIKTDS